MTAEAAAKLISMGGLGIYALVVTLAIKGLYADLKAERTKCAAEMSDLRKQHADEVKSITDRYMAKADTINDKQNETLDSLGTVLEALSRKFERGGGR